MKWTSQRCLLRHQHDSVLEADYCNWLLARKQNGEIKDFDAWYTVPLKINGKDWKKWTADFRVVENDNTISIHEAKGFNPSDDNFRMKLSVFFINYPEIPVYVNKRLVKPTPSGRICIRERRKKRAWPTRPLRERLPYRD